MKIKLDSTQKAIGFFLVLIGSLVLNVLAAAQGNQFWSSPLIGLAVMFFFGEFPPQGKHEWFSWVYFILIIGSGGLLVFTPEKVYWTTPLLLGVIINLFAMPEIEFTKKSDDHH